MMSSLIAPASEISLLYLTPRYRLLGRKGQTNYQAHVIRKLAFFFRVSYLINQTHLSVL